MNINIGMIKVNTIGTIGSLNIGKVILCRNESNVAQYGTGEMVGDGVKHIPEKVPSQQLELPEAPEPSPVPPVPAAPPAAS
ncbi:hypothetical protein [Paenibacillus thermotolerans]|uniref:hypothetical protein n=1 Tax=Paenibacillus thermotolerans TaxID=3027807 RepID=UPI0023678C88|nr:MULTISPECIES: hypothetical protein [unclassified Paenibacillus]